MQTATEVRRRTLSGKRLSTLAPSTIARMPFAVMASVAEGTGRITARFEGEFIRDLARVLGVWEE